MRKEITLTPPKSLVRYPRAAILTLYAALIALYWLNPSATSIFLTVPAIWLILSIDDREEQRKGFYKAIDQIIKQS